MVTLLLRFIIANTSVTSVTNEITLN